MYVITPFLKARFISHGALWINIGLTSIGHCIYLYFILSISDRGGSVFITKETHEFRKRIRLRKRKIPRGHCQTRGCRKESNGGKSYFPLDLLMDITLYMLYVTCALGMKSVIRLIMALDRNSDNVLI